jgi:hypothetical protein
MSKASEYAKALSRYQGTRPMAPGCHPDRGYLPDLTIEQTDRVPDARVTPHGELELKGTWHIAEIPALIAWLTDTFTEPQNLAHSPRCSVNVVPGTGCTCHLNKSFTDGGA